MEVAKKDIDIKDMDDNALVEMRNNEARKALYKKYKVFLIENPKLRPTFELFVNGSDPYQVEQFLISRPDSRQTRNLTDFIKLGHNEASYLHRERMNRIRELKKEKSLRQMRVQEEERELSKKKIEEEEEKEKGDMVKYERL